MIRDLQPRLLEATKRQFLPGEDKLPMQCAAVQLRQQRTAGSARETHKQGSYSLRTPPRALPPNMGSWMPAATSNWSCTTAMGTCVPVTICNCSFTSAAMQSLLRDIPAMHSVMPSTNPGTALLCVAASLSSETHVQAHSCTLSLQKNRGASSRSVGSAFPLRGVQAPSHACMYALQGWLSHQPMPPHETIHKHGGLHASSHTPSHAVLALK